MFILISYLTFSDDVSFVQMPPPNLYNYVKAYNLIISADIVIRKVAFHRKQLYFCICVFFI